MSPKEPANDDRTRTVDGPQAASDANNANEAEAEADDSVASAAKTGAGKRFGRFELVERIGQGGMGVVYRATDKMLSRDVAIKVLKGGATSPERRLRMQREAQAMAALSHPNLVTVYDAGIDGDEFFIAMEYVHGYTLAGWLQAEQRTWQEISRVFLEAGRGLEAAHATGIVHRDFKPSNVLVSKDGRVQVTDFGIALTSGEQGDDEGAAGEPVQLTKTGVALGTPKYMSPEQHEAKKVDARSDQFSFAVALAEAVYGAHPFAAESFREMVHKVVQGRPTLPANRGPAKLEPLLRRALAHGRDDRFESMTDLLARLETLRNGAGRPWLTAAALTAMVALGFVAVMLGRSTGAYMSDDSVEAVAPATQTRAVRPSVQPTTPTTATTATTATTPTTPIKTAAASVDAGAPVQTTPDASPVARKRRANKRPTRRATAPKLDASVATPPAPDPNYEPAQRIGRFVYRNRRCVVNHASKSCDRCCGKDARREILMPYPNCGCYHNQERLTREANLAAYSKATPPGRIGNKFLVRRCGTSGDRKTCSKCCRSGDTATPFPKCGCYNSTEKGPLPPRRLEGLTLIKRCTRKHAQRRCAGCCRQPGTIIKPYPSCGCYYNAKTWRGIRPF